MTRKPKIDVNIAKMLSSFTHPHVIPKPVSISFFCWTQNIFWRIVTKQTSNQFWFPLTSIVMFVHTLKVNGNRNCLVQTLLKKSTFFKISYFVFRTRKSHRFGTTWGWVNDDRIFFLVGLSDLIPGSLLMWGGHGRKEGDRCKQMATEKARGIS